jgi:hypothetical protein
MRRDFHGSGIYDLDDAPVGQASLALAWIVDGTKRQFKRFLMWAAPPSGSATLVRGGERNFSKLGAQPSKEPVRADDCPFPKKTARTDHNWRVLP